VPILFAKNIRYDLGAKYIPLTRNQCRIIFRQLNAILSYIHETGKADFVDGK
jgi:hypothetical protein